MDTEQFGLTANTPDILVLPGNKLMEQISNGVRAMVFLRLKNSPIPQTLQLQWHVFVQPKSTYFVLDGAPNVVGFRWGEPIENLRSHPIEVSYVADKSASEAEAIGALSVKDNLPSGDGKRLTLDAFSRFVLSGTSAVPVPK